MPWSEFIKEQCSGIIDVESNVPETRIPLPCRSQGKPKVNGSRLLFSVGGVLFIAYDLCEKLNPKKRDVYKRQEKKNVFTRIFFELLLLNKQQDKLNR